ncbi:MAG: type II toxin-antitoxin system HicB family antitoxin [Desulfovibrionales bacterium]|nr:MAG: type II toxin-antitoxin system HicB family antitoxin [Desulfovibrionales bacterium]
MRIELEREDDGRWIAEVPELPGVMVYGTTREQAISNVKALALRTMADQIENDSPVSGVDCLFAVPA